MRDRRTAEAIKKSETGDEPRERGGERVATASVVALVHAASKTTANGSARRRAKARRAAARDYRAEARGDERRKLDQIPRRLVRRCFSRASANTTSHNDSIEGNAGRRRRKPHQCEAKAEHGGATAREQITGGPVITPIEQVRAQSRARPSLTPLDNLARRSHAPPSDSRARQRDRSGEERRQAEATQRPSRSLRSIREARRV